MIQRKGKDKKDQKDHNDLFNQIEPPRRKVITKEHKEKLKENVAKDVAVRYGVIRKVYL